MIRAYCYASGRIDFGRDIPAGATIIARGPDRELRGFIGAEARRGRMGRDEALLVPGVPEAANQIAAREALRTWSKWIATKAPFGVRVLPS